MHSESHGALSGRDPVAEAAKHASVHCGAGIYHSAKRSVRQVCKYTHRRARAIDFDDDLADDRGMRHRVSDSRYKETEFRELLFDWCRADLGRACRNSCSIIIFF